MKTKPLFLICCLYLLHSYAQTVEPSYSVKREVIQIELESQYFRQQEKTIKTESWSLPNVLVRYGIFQNIEFQFNLPVIREKYFSNNKLIHSEHQFDDLQAGLGINLWNQRKLLPQTSIMLRALVPSQNLTRFDVIGSVISLNMSNRISETWTLGYNVGFVKESNMKPISFYIVNLWYDYNEKVHFFIENFGEFDKTGPLCHSLNMGTGYNLSDRLTIDCSITKGLNHNMYCAGMILTWVIS